MRNPFKRKSDEAAAPASFILRESEGAGRALVLEPSREGEMRADGSALSPVPGYLLAPVTELLRSGSLANVLGSSDLYRMTGSIRTIEGLTSGHLQVMQRHGHNLSAVVDESNRIRGHVEYQKVGSGQAVAPALVFAVLAIATQQYYLPQIRNSLLGIETAVRDLKDARLRERHGTLTAAEKKADHLWEFLLERQAAQEDRDALELISFEVASIFEAQRSWLHQFCSVFLNALEDNRLTNREVDSLLRDGGSHFQEEALLLLHAIGTRARILLLELAFAGTRGEVRSNLQMRRTSEGLTEMRDEADVLHTVVSSLLYDPEAISAWDRLSRRGYSQKLSEALARVTALETLLEHEVLLHLPILEDAPPCELDLQVSSNGEVVSAALRVGE